MRRMGGGVYRRKATAKATREENLGCEEVESEEADGPSEE